MNHNRLHVFNLFSSLPKNFKSLAKTSHFNSIKPYSKTSLNYADQPESTENEINPKQNKPAELDYDVDINLTQNPDSVNEINTQTRDRSFKYNEIITAKVKNNLKYINNRITNRLIKLKKNAIFDYKYTAIMHEHIISKSSYLNKNGSADVSFGMDSLRIDFKRPTLYEYVSLNEHTAVSSHFSVITIVPLLLELNKNSRVLECGTGSGSMSLFLSERLGNSGLLHTFDQTDNKARKAKQKFWEWKDSYDLSAGENEKWPSNVKFGVADFCAQKFNESFLNFYDAIYLDMADTNIAIENAYKLVKVNGVVVINCLHLTQIIKLLNNMRKKGLAFESELVIEPSNKFWEIRKLGDGAKGLVETPDTSSKNTDLNWTCRLEDRFNEKFKRGGLFFNYWAGFLIKLRKIK